MNFAKNSILYRFPGVDVELGIKEEPFCPDMADRKINTCFQNFAVIRKLSSGFRKKKLCHNRWISVPGLTLFRYSQVQKGGNCASVSMADRRGRICALASLCLCVTLLSMVGIGSFVVGTERHHEYAERLVDPPGARESRLRGARCRVGWIAASLEGFSYLRSIRMKSFSGFTRWVYFPVCYRAILSVSNPKSDSAMGARSLK